MDTSYMREFLVLAKHLNYTMAAQALYISQPTLSRHISALEDELGARLLNRTRHAVSLTPSGEAAVASFNAIVQHSDELVGAIGELTYESIMSLRVGMVYFGISAFYGNSLIQAFSSRNPDVNVSTVTSHMGRIYESLYRKTIDTALTVAAPCFKDETLDKAVIDTIPQYVIVQPGHPFEKRKSIKPEELITEKVAFIFGPDSRVSYAEELLKKRNIKPRLTEHTDNMDSLVFSMSSLGRVHIGTKLMAAIPDQNFIFVPIDDSEFAEDIVLLYLKDNSNPNLTKLVDSISVMQKPNM